MSWRKGGGTLGKVQGIIADFARNYAKKNINDQTCIFIVYQPKVSENLKKRLQETKKQK